MAEDVLLEGLQGDDMLLWDPRPTRYRDEEIRASIRRDVRRERRRGDVARVFDEMLPLLRPRASFGPRVIERERELKRADADRRRRSYSSRYGGAGSASGAERYGGSSSSDRYGPGTRSSRQRSYAARYGG